MANRVIAFHYTMSDADGNVIYSSEGKDPLAFLEGVGQVLPGLESTLATMTPGEKKSVELSCDQAFGAHDSEKIVQVPKQELPQQEIKVGDQFSANEEEGIFTVTEVSDTHVTLDGNHPLAGVDLTFDLELVDAREATADEMAHGHVHGPGGHHHH